MLRPSLTGSSRAHPNTPSTGSPHEGQGEHGCSFLTPEPGVLSKSRGSSVSPWQHGEVLPRDPALQAEQRQQRGSSFFLHRARATATHVGPSTGSEGLTERSGAHRVVWGSQAHVLHHPHPAAKPRQGEPAEPSGILGSNYIFITRDGHICPYSVMCVLNHGNSAIFPGLEALW